MAEKKRKFSRQGEAPRREALIAAALEMIALHGVSGATVRGIAEGAGVTPGLIRHYFNSKAELTRAAYQSVMGRMTADSLAKVEELDTGPEGRLAAFVAASLRAPVVDPKSMGLWAGFLHSVQSDPTMRDVHEATYLEYRDTLQGLIAALPRDADAARLRRDAIACNGIIDGLWLEGCALPEAFRQDELAQIGVAAVGAILGLDLAAHLPASGKDME